MQAQKSTVIASNEELAILYQQGDREAVKALYEQNTGLIYRFAYSYYMQNIDRCISCGISSDDIAQEAFFAICEAAKAYKAAEEYKFTTYLSRHLKNCFNGLVGYRTDKQKYEPLNNCDSLNRPAGNDESETEKGDLLEDPNSSAAFDYIEDSDYSRELHEVISHCLSEISEEQSLVIKSRYYANKTMKQTGQDIGKSAEQIRQIEAKALRALRHPRRARILKSFLYETSEAYTATGFSAWKSGGSVEERLLERAEWQKSIDKYS